MDKNTIYSCFAEWAGFREMKGMMKYADDRAFTRMFAANG